LSLYIWLVMYFAASFVMYFTEFEIKKIICEKYQYAIRNQIVINPKNKKWVSDMGMRWKYFEPGGGTRTGGEDGSCMETIAQRTSG